MGERQEQPFQLSFNGRLGVDFQGARVTSDGGLLLVRELDERLGFGELIKRHLTDERARNTQLPLADLVRQSIYSRPAGYEDVNDAERLSQDPAFRLIGSSRIWERGAALTSRLQSFETDLLTQPENLRGLSRISRELVAKAEAIGSSRRVVLDMDSTEVPVYGRQEQSAYNGHFESTCYHPLLLFNGEGDCLAAKLRPGNVHSAEGWEELLLPEIDRQQGQGKEVAFRGDAAFAKPEPYEAVEERNVRYAIRLPANDNLERKITKVVDPPGGKAELQAGGPLQELSLPSSELHQGRARGGEGGIPLRRAVPAGWLHRNQLPDFRPGGGTLLQQARNGRAVDQRRQAGGGDDTAFLPPLPGRRGAAVAQPARLQPRQPVAAAGAAGTGRQLVAEQPAAAAYENRRAVDKARPLLLAAAGGESSDAAAVWSHGAHDCHAAGAGGIGGREIGADFGDDTREGRKRCPRNRLTNGIPEA